jgi:hypothetical protein
MTEGRDIRNISAAFCGLISSLDDVCSEPFDCIPAPRGEAASERVNDFDTAGVVI